MKIPLISFLLHLHLVEGGDDLADFVAAGPIHGHPLPFLPGSVDRLEEPFERNADRPSVGNQRNRHNGQQQQGGQAGTDAEARLGLGLHPCIGQRNREASDDLIIAGDVDDVPFGKEILPFYALDLAGRADQVVLIVIDGRAQDIGVDQEGGENELDLLVGDVP